jgi:hypothetical protein
MSGADRVQPVKFLANVDTRFICVDELSNDQSQLDLSVTFFQSFRRLLDPIAERSLRDRAT